MNSAAAFAASSNPVIAAFSSAPAADLAIDAETLVYKVNENGIATGLYGIDGTEHAFAVQLR